MPNASQHRAGACVALAALQAIDEHRKFGRITSGVLLAALGGYSLGTLPDLLEPSLRNPNHRGFGHSVVLGVFVGYVAWRLHQWTPDTRSERIVRAIFLTVAGAYLIHLLLDSTTPRSLPFI